MAKKLSVTVEQLKTAVEMTGTTGEWQDKGRGQWQFRANDGAILNFWVSSGTINFQGPETERREFEQIFDLAVAKLLETSGRSDHATQEDVRPGRYRHFKGKDYEVIGVARHSETEEELVVYRALYGEWGLWVRPKAMFMEEVTVEGRRVRRFEFVE